MEDYDLAETLAESTHTKVFRGRQKRTTDYYAIKRVSLLRKDRTMNEGQAMHQLDHERVLKFKAWFVTKNNIWLVLEYCVGGALLTILKEDLKLPEAFIRTYGADLAEALQYLHSQGVMHANLKPSNVLLDGIGRVKLAGLGLCVRLADAHTGSLRRRGAASPCYMAPELFSEDAPFSSASDIWALGCMLYECAAGHPPFLSASFQDLVNDILHTEPDPLQGASAEMQNLPDFEAYCAAHYPPPEPSLPPAEEQESIEDVRASVANMSLAACGNLLKDVSAMEPVAGQAAAVVQGSIHLHHADAELDFEPSEEAEGQAGDHMSQVEPSAYDNARASDGAPQSAADDPAEPMDEGREHAIQEETALMRASVAAARLRHSPEDASAESSHAHAGATAAAVPAAGILAEGDAGSLEELLWRAEANAQPRPLIGNRRIEAVPEPSWDPHLLGFPALTAEALLDPPPQRTETHLTDIFRALSLPLNLKEKVNVCNYLETLCAEQTSPGLVDALAECAKDKGVAVRRRAMASLGELLFYIASQQGGSQWHVSSSALGLLTKALRPGEDPTYQQYAVHAMHNIASCSHEWVGRLATNETARALMQMTEESAHTPAALREIAAATLAYFLHVVPALSQYVLGTGGWDFFVAGLADGSVKVQTSTATQLGLVLMQAPMQAMLHAAPQEAQRSVVLGVLSLLSCPSEAGVVKGIALLALMASASSAWLLMACEGNLASLIEGLQGAQTGHQHHQAKACPGSEVQDALKLLMATICQRMTVLGPQVRDATAQMLQAGCPDTHAEAEQQKDLLNMLGAATTLMPSALMRAHMPMVPLLHHLCETAELCSCRNAGRSHAQAANFKEQVLLVLEAVCKECTAVMDLWEPVLQAVVPLLCRLAGSDKEEGVVRFVSLEYLCGVFTALLSAAPTDGSSAATAHMQQGVRAALEGAVLEVGVQVLLCDPPLPMHGLKLLASILQLQPSSVHILSRMKAAQLCFHFLAFEIEENNLQTLQVCTALLRSGAVPVSLLISLDIGAKVAAIVQSVVQSNTASFWEPVAELALALLTHAPDSTIIDHLSLHMRSLLDLILLTNGQHTASRCAAECIRSLVSQTNGTEASGDVNCGNLQRSLQKAAWKLLHAPVANTLGTALHMEGAQEATLQPLMQSILAAASLCSCAPGSQASLQAALEAVASDASLSESTCDMGRQAASALHAKM
ncbi:hypothetical protein WJX73_005406 [Symbiochloris irregularis]|uniref:Protein kinase domain-containing protein n=1 Tax=Symbiochloris irregularis TaxID=706552 RepID=A0AAW1PZU7_9CHLO